MQENSNQDPLTATRKHSRLTRLRGLARGPVARERSELERKRRRPETNRLSLLARPLCVLTGAGLLATLLAVGLGGVASAQTVIEDVSGPTEVVGSVARVAQGHAVQVDDDTDGSSFFEFSPEDETVWGRFEQCMTDAGLTSDPRDASDGEPDEATIDAAFGQCDPILDGLSEDVDITGDFEDLSPEDEAVFDQYDECLTEAGLDELFEGAEVDGAEFDEAAIDAAFEQCDPILGGLSEQAQEVFGDFEDLLPEDEAVFDQYEECLSDAGLDELFEGAEVDGAEVDGAEFDEAAIDAAFEQCDPILDGLSEQAQEVFGDCPDNDEHSDAAVEELEGVDA